MHKFPSKLPNYVTSKSNFYEISNIDDSLIKHEFKGLGHISLLNHHSIQYFKEKEGLLQDGYNQLLYEENKTQIFVETLVIRITYMRDII